MRCTFKVIQEGVKMAGKAALLVVVAGLSFRGDGIRSPHRRHAPRRPARWGRRGRPDLRQAGNDSIRARGGRDEIHGQADGDRVKAGAGDDVSYGGGGPDNMWAGGGADRQFGGPGDDASPCPGRRRPGGRARLRPGQDVAWLSQNERGLYRIDDCEILKIVVPSAEQFAEENEDYLLRRQGQSL